MCNGIPIYDIAINISPDYVNISIDICND